MQKCCRTYLFENRKIAHGRVVINMNGTQSPRIHMINGIMHNAIVQDIRCNIAIYVRSSFLLISIDIIKGDINNCVVVELPINIKNKNQVKE